MSAAPNDSEIMQALRESGYLMEQHVASAFESLNFVVNTNYPYEDPDEGKSREIDVRSIRNVCTNQDRLLSAFSELIVECKNSSNPFVFITRDKNNFDLTIEPSEFIFPIKYETVKDLGDNQSVITPISPFFHLGFDKVHEDHIRKSKAVQFCRIDRNGRGWHANHGGLYDAIFYPLVKAVHARKAEIPKGRNPGDWRYLWFFFPLVVTSGALLEVDSALSDPQPRSRDWISFRRELRSGKLKGQFVVTFVRQDRLAEFVSACVQPIENLARDLVQNRPDIVLNKIVPEGRDPAG